MLVNPLENLFQNKTFGIRMQKRSQLTAKTQFTIVQSSPS